MKVRLFVAAGLCGLLSLSFGCMKGSYAEVATRSPAELREVPDQGLVAVYGQQREVAFTRSSTIEKLRAEIERRALFDAEQWQMIDAKQIRIGEPELLVWASWGKPDRIDSLTTADGERRGLVYDDSVSIVYIEGGKVTAILD